MPSELFDEILEKITPAIEKQVTKFGSALQPGLKAAGALLYIYYQGFPQQRCQCLSELSKNAFRVLQRDS